MKPLLPAALAAAVVVSAAIHLVAVLVPELRGVFQTYALVGEDWVVLVALSAAIIPAIELLKLAQRAGVVGSDLGPMSRK
jgi:Ca2+-transporting ATPase